MHSFKELEEARAALEAKMAAALQTEIDHFIQKGGICPASIDVQILHLSRIGNANPERVLGGVTVRFGL